jgi:hypothetical protein
MAEKLLHCEFMRIKAELPFGFAGFKDHMMNFARQQWPLRFLRKAHMNTYLPHSEVEGLLKVINS